MKKMSIRNIIFIASLIPVIPIVALGIILFSEASSDLSMLKMIFAVAFVLVVASLGIQNYFISKFIRGTKKLINKMNMVANGDLTAYAIKESIPELKDLSLATDNVINILKDFASDVDISSTEVGHLITTVKDTATELIRNGANITQAVEHVAEGAMNQAEDAETCYNMSTELVEQMSVVMESTDLMSKKAEHVKHITDSGKTNISELLDKSKLAEANITEIIDSIKELHNMASNINNITEIISDIASQTNLLSLNASIEAARAGEAGRGFAVVAGEVKRLADKSLESVNDIEMTIVNLQNQVNKTTEKIAATIETIKQQIDSVHKTNEAFIEISEASDELFAQLSFVRQGMNKLDDYKANLADAIQNISAVAAETAASSEEITSLMYTQNNSFDVLAGLSSNMDSIFDSVNEKLEHFKFDKLSKSKKTFALILNGAATYHEDIAESAQKIAKRLGVNIVTLYEKVRNVDRQVEFINESIRQGVDGIALIPLGEGREKIQPVIAEAVNKGIKVIVMDTLFPDCGISELISTDNYKAGVNVGEITAKYLKGRGNIIISLTGDQNLNMINRVNGFKSVIEKMDNIKLVDIVNEPDLSLRADAIKAKLDEYPEINCIVYLDNDGAKVQNDLIEKYNIRLTSIGFDKNDISMKMIEEGKLDAVVAQRQGLWGELAIKRLNDLATGKKVPEFEDTGTFEINKRNYFVYSK